MVPLHVVAGFLGTGKTTVLQNLLGQLPASERVGLVVNDFGTAALDATALQAPEIRAIGGACLCCTAPAGFAAAVQSLLDSGVQRIFVEPTGIARPADLIDTLRRLPWRERFDLRPLLVVVDPERLDATRRAQAEVADLLIVNRTDLASPAALASATDWIASLWPGPARVVTTAFGAVPLSILDPLPSPPFRPVARAVPTETWSARSWSWAPDAVFDRRRLLAALETEGLARAKGRLRTDEGFGAFEKAGGTLHESPTGWRRDSRIDAIAADPAALDQLDALLNAALTDRKVVDGLEVVTPDGVAVRWHLDALRALPGGVPDVTTVVPGRSGPAASVGALLAGTPDDTLAVAVAADGYVSEPTPVSLLKTGFIVYNITEKEGGPLRLLLPPGAGSGCANVKSLVRIALR